MTDPRNALRPDDRPRRRPPSPPSRRSRIVDKVVSKVREVIKEIVGEPAPDEGVEEGVSDGARCRRSPPRLGSRRARWRTWSGASWPTSGPWRNRPRSTST